MATVEAGQWVWVPHDEEAYIACKVSTNFKPGEDATVTDEEGNEMTVPGKKTVGIMTLDPEAINPIDNLVKLNDLNEAVILHNLKLRFKKDVIYTYVSSILIAVNPFRMLPIYTPEVLDSYKDGNTRDLPPHIFAIADNAYKSMLGDVRDQAVVISGESGAGKTETMKLVLQYLAEVSGRAVVAKKEGDGQEGLEQQILKANPVMEAFGNAKTMRNNNSSRFGKWTEVVFNRAGAIVGGSIINYLLEKSRLPHQSEGERNYHVFYQLLEGANARPELKAALELQDPEDYHYLNQSGVTSVENINDEKEFEDLDNAMDVLQMSAEEKETIFRLVAAILALGNIEFEADVKATEEDGSKVKGTEWIERAAKQLRVDPASLSKCLTYKNIGTRSIIFVSYSVDQAAEARDGMCKTIYGKLFDWLIKKINISLSRGIGAGATGDKSIIGVLDIFGFESFETNSFEQLCINFCNEKLQFHFNEHIFRLEQEEYASEGISVDAIDFADNQPCLDLLEQKKTGVFAMIDDEINVPKGSDDGFLRKVLKEHAKHPNCKKPKPKELNSRQVFIVVHYAGPVSYNSTNFLEKNKDSLHGDITAVVHSSSDPFIAELLKEPESKTEEKPDPKKRSRRKKPGKKQATLGSQFRKQLNALMTTLNATDPHFVRCMKPNHVKKGRIFEAPMMLNQLRYAGLLEVCRIRQIGYPVRKKFDDFHFRYRCLGLGSADHMALLNHLQETGLIKAGQWATGNSKVFMRNNTQSDLETAREEALKEVVIKIQRQARRYIQRCRMLRYLEIIAGLQAAVASRSPKELEHWLNMTAELPSRGTHLDAVKAARAALQRIEEENRVRTLLAEAIASRELAQVNSALAAAEAMSYTCAEVEQAKALKATIEEERRVLSELKAATKARDKEAMGRLLDRCDELGLADSDEAKQATVLKQRIEEEEEAVEELRAAIAGEDLKLLNACLTRLAEMGLEPPEVAQAQKLRDHLQAQLKAKHALREALTSRKLSDLRAAIAKAASVGLEGADSCPEVADALRSVDNIEAENAALAAVEAAADAGDVAAIDAAVAAASALGLKPSQPAFVRAAQVKERIEAENAAVEQLKAALATNDPDKLNSAISKAAELGLDVPELSQARGAVAKLGAQNESLAAINTALASNDLEQVRAAIAAAEGQGLGDSESVAGARKVADRLEAEKAAADELAAVTAGEDVAAIERCIAEANRLNLAKRYGEVVAAGKAKLAALQRRADAEAAVHAAIKSADLAALGAALETATELGVAAAVLEEGVAAKAHIQEQEAITEELVAALETKDRDVLAGLIQRAEAAGLDNDKVNSARIVVDREKFIADTRALLEEAMANNDLDKLNTALAKVTELGMEGEDIEAAEARKEELEKDRELASTLIAAVKSAELKAQGGGELEEADYAPLQAAIDEALSNGLAEESPSLAQARGVVDRMSRIVVLQGEMAGAMEEGTLKQLRELLEQGDDLGMAGGIVADVKARIRALERERAQAVAAGAEPDWEEEEEDDFDGDDDEIRKAREEKLAKARAPKYHWTKFNNIRDPDDFAKGVLFGKKKVKANQLKWQSGVIKKSMTFLEGRRLGKIATRMHKSLLGYAGDKSMAFPATLAQDILNKGIEYPDVVDEIYVQVMKHLTDNPRPESVRAGWQVLCMATGTFPPSSELENYVLNFILEQRDGSGVIGNYARYALRRLEGSMSSGSSGFVPSVEEIQAYKERPPILATIELVDGTPLTEDLPITPDLSVAKVLDICTHFMELEDPRKRFFGIFVCDVDEELAYSHPQDSRLRGQLKRTPRPLQNDSFMGDIVTQKTRSEEDFKFVFKRKVYLRNDDDPSEDPMFERLVYLQAVDEVILGNIPVDDQDLVSRLVCIAMVVDLEADMPEDVDGLIDSSLEEYIPIQWRTEQELEEWGKQVLAHRADLIDADPEELQSMFVGEVCEDPTYGTHFFYVTKNNFPAHLDKFEGDDLIIAFNSDGLHFMTLERDILMSFGYADIYRWGGSSTQFSIIIWNADTQDTDDVSMFTTQANDMAALILDYIQAIMAAAE